MIDLERLKNTIAFEYNKNFIIAYGYKDSIKLDYDFIDGTGDKYLMVHLQKDRLETLISMLQDLLNYKD